MDRLKGKVAVITGCSSGVGAVTAQKFAAEGAKVVISARRQQQLEEVADKIRAALSAMTKTGKGSIVNVSSAAGVVGNGGAAYVASKAAILGITRHTALRFAGTGIRCNAICPGTIVTPMVAGMRPDTMDMDMFGQMGKHSDMRVPPCMPEDVANMLIFFASDESRAITGQSLVTDFGSTL